MCEVTLGQEKILLARVASNFYAVAAHCPHYGVSLAGGLLCGDRLVCQWHKSCFRVTDGALLDGPALDGLKRYSVTVEGDDIYLSARESDSQTQKANADKRCFAIVGAGAAGSAAADTLRERGFSGRIALITAEGESPYDRTKLSKEFLSGNAGAEQLPLRPEAFYRDKNIELVRKEVSEIDALERTIRFEDGSNLTCDALLIATGGEPRSAAIAGAELGNVFVLRTQAQAEEILANSPPGTRAVILGGSFIALEAASCFGLRKVPTTVVLPESEPFSRQFGEQVGGAIRRLHEAHRIEFRRNRKATRLEGTGVVQRVVLDSGETLPADVVIIGVGVQPRTDFIKGVRKEDDGGITVNTFLKAAPSVYAAGDVAVFPLPLSHGAARVEHWRVAGQHGRTAAANMLGATEPFSGVPYFWTNHFGTRFDYLGHAEKWEEVIVQGDLEKPEFIAYYVIEGRIRAASATGKDLEIAALHELMRLNKTPTPEQVSRGIDLVMLAKDACSQALKIESTSPATV